jgi:epoxyqueuosine reductase
MALAAGFSAAGISDLRAVERSDALFERWLEAGNHGEMSYLSLKKGIRRDPRSMMPGARSALCLALNYFTHDAPGGEGGGARRGTFARYARRGDYHAIVKTLLQRLDGMLHARFPGMRSVLCVDTKPVAERTLALQSGVGWLGKNTCVIADEYGSWIVLGEIISDLELRGDSPRGSLCGDCTRCIEACPTGALVEPFVLDSRRCISYLTIEKRGEIPASLRPAMGTSLFGCDACQQACPYNGAAQDSRVFLEQEECRLVSMDIDSLAVIDDARFNELARESAILRCRAAGMRRNAAIALENLGRSGGE